MAFLIDDILLSPIKGIIWLASKVRDVALEELTDTPEKLQRELLDYQLALEAEQISETEYQKREKEVLERIQALNNKDKKSSLRPPSSPAEARK